MTGTDTGRRVPAGLRRAAGILLVAALAATACGFAGVWQWSRHVDRSTTIERVEANYDAPARPLEDVLGRDGALPADAEWSQALLRGRYVAAEPVLLRNRPVDGRPAVRLLHQVEVTDGAWAGRTLVVDRGWVATADGGPQRRPPAPEGTVSLVVRLRPTEDGPVEPSGDRQVRDIVPEAVAAAAGTGSTGEPLPVYGLLSTEDGAPPADAEPMPPPRTTLGNNLSYAFQWWVFALGALGGAVVLIRRDRETDEQHPQDTGVDGVRPAVPHADKDVRRRRRRPTAEEEEDALLDAQVQDGRGRDPVSPA